MSNQPRGKMVRARAKVRTTHPISHKYCYPGDQDTFTIGKGFPLEELPKHWEAIHDKESDKAPPLTEAENLLEVQVKGMTAGKIANYILVYYGVKIEAGQAQETAYRQAIEIIRDDRFSRKPESEIMAGLAALNDTPAREESTGPAPIPEGQGDPVVPGKEDGGNDAPPEKLFKELNPDEIDDMERAEIFAKVKRMYNVDIANVGNKSVVLGKALEVEASALAVKEAQ